MKPPFAAHTPPEGSHKWHDLSEHLRDVAAKASNYATKFNADKLGHYAGLWHDLGKYNPDFQLYLYECYKNTVDSKTPKMVPHAIHGAKLAWQLLQPIAPIIYGHHAGLPEIQGMKDRLAELDAHSFEIVREHASQESIDIQIKESKEELGRLLKQLCNDDYSYEFLIRLLFSCLVDADYLDTEEHFALEIAQQRGSNISIKNLWATLEQNQNNLLRQSEQTPVNDIRAEVYHACIDAAQQSTGIFRLVVPTGGGKTRSGLAFGLNHAVRHRLDRVIVAVPYTSIIEQTVRVYRDILGEEAVLEHHSATRVESGNKEVQQKQDESARRKEAQARLATQNWDAPLIVTTTVQLFESLLANRPSKCRKLHNIVGSVIILDEVQTLPVSLLEPMISVLQELCDRYRVTVVLCTATQPALQEKSPYLKGFQSIRDIVPITLVKQHFSILSRVDYEIPSNPWSWEDIVQDVLTHEYQQALIVLNTRKDTLKVLQVFQNNGFEDKLFYLSTLLCGKHRQLVLTQVRDRLRLHKPCILVSTQVVEAGVDLDFPAVYRALGPLDRLVQAAGRCNREGRMPQKGRVVIFEPQEGKVPPGEYKIAVDETRKLLKRPDLDLHNPEIFKEYFRCLYQDINTDSYDIQSVRKRLNYPEVASRFKLIKDDTTPVVVQYDDDARFLIRAIEQRGLYSSDHRTLQPYMVNLRHREFQQSEALRKEIAPGLWVWQGKYDSLKGIAIGDNPIDYDPQDLIH